MIVILSAKNIDRKSSFNVAIFSLALADFLVSVFGLPTYILSTNFFRSHFIGRNGDWMCQLLTGYFLPYWFLDASVFLLVYIALERRKAILYPSSSLLEPKSFKCNLAIMILIYFLAFLVQISNAIFQKYSLEPDPMKFGNFCKYSLKNSTFLYIIGFFLDTFVPVIVIVWCFYQIYWTLKKIDDFLGTILDIYSDRNHKSNVVKARKVNTIKTIKIIAIAFCVCVLPNRLLYLTSPWSHNWSSLFYWNQYVSQIFVLMRFSNSFINPMVYCLQSKEFRRHLLTVFCKRKLIASNGYRRLPGMTF